MLGLIFVGFALSMDAFAAAVCLGLKFSSYLTFKRFVEPALCFGLFQGIMPYLGYLSGSLFSAKFIKYGHILATIILVLIGLNMIVGSLRDDEDEDRILENYSLRMLLGLGVATSIDAFAFGVGLCFVNYNILRACLVFGVMTFLFSLVGVKLGGAFGNKYKKGAEILGGLILIFVAAFDLL